jgi:hypothetical protein
MYRYLAWLLVPCMGHSTGRTHSSLQLPLLDFNLELQLYFQPLSFADRRSYDNHLPPLRRLIHPSVLLLSRSLRSNTRIVRRLASEAQLQPPSSPRLDYTTEAFEYQAASTQPPTCGQTNHTAQSIAWTGPVHTTTR